MTKLLLKADGILRDTWCPLDPPRNNAQTDVLVQDSKQSRPFRVSGYL